MGDLAACARCGIEKPEISFSLKRNSATIRSKRCDSCRAAKAVTWTSENPTRARAAMERFRAKDGPRAGRLSKKYGIAPADYTALLDAQNGGCAICASRVSGGRWSVFHVDHDHVTGSVRGLLCTNCNRGIGYMADDAARLRRAADYLGANKMVVPNWEDAARVIYDAMGFAYEGRSVDLDGNPYGSWKTACDAATDVLALFTAPDDTKQAGSYNRGGEDCTEVQARKPMPLDAVEGER